MDKGNQLNIIKVSDYDEMSNKASERIIQVMKEKKNPVLGLATGSTPVGMYKQLIKAYENKEISFRNTATFNLDEYVGLSKDDPNSYFHFMQENLFQHVDILPENTHLPKGIIDDMEAECTEYEKLIHEKGPIQLQVLGLGMNGHIGFNEPGTPFSSKTHVIELDESTREANARFFARLEDVPKYAITMGITTIMESEEILLLVSGENKAEPLARLVQGEISEEFPATILKQHKNVTIIADEAAMSKLD